MQKTGEVRAACKHGLVIPATHFQISFESRWSRRSRCPAVKPHYNEAVYAAKAEGPAIIGKTLGHYEIVEKLGEGGMGAVYKAHDSHLNRFVAIKLLLPDQVANPERKSRFVQEARAASALNHPNIITIYDIDQADGIHFIAMECVAGKTLEEVIPRKGMPFTLALKYAIQIAEGLARAHGAGILHRDLKPSNVMVDEHGLVKILDFGLAKLTEPVGVEKEEGRTAATVTAEGAVIGTAAFMSPEQAEGKQVDPRSDIFSFGSLLYEMITGQRAFKGATRVSTIASMLRDEPKPVSELVEGFPREAERIIRRCLRKDPEQRFQTMADLRVALRELKEDSESGALEGPLPKASYRVAWSVAGAGLILLLALVAYGIWFYSGESGSAGVAAAPVPLTAYAGDESMPSFSPDGSQVAFMWNGEEENNFDIYVKLVGAEPPLRLTKDPAYECSPAWSPDGRWIAFMRLPRGAAASLVVIPPLGGPERILAETQLNSGTVAAHYVGWSPDSRWLAMVGGDTPEAEPAILLISLETGEKRNMTVPPQSSLGDSCPSFSSDGRTLAFFRWTSYSNSVLHLLDLAGDLSPLGDPRPLATGNWRASSPVWTGNRDSLVFAAASNLWRVDASGRGKPERLSSFGAHGSHPAIAQTRKRLAYAQELSDVNIYRIELVSALGKAGQPQKFVASTRIDSRPKYSPDGRKVAFVSERSGSPEIWVCDADGSNSVQVTFLGGPSIGSAPDWSPDCRRLTFEANLEGHPEVYVVSAAGGSPQRITRNPAGSGNPNWSKDGLWIFFDTTHVGIQKVPVDGGQPVRLPSDGWGWGPVESPDGKLIYTVGWSGQGSTLLRAPVEGGAPEEVLASLHSGQSFVVVEDGIYFTPRADPRAGYSIQFWRSATGTIDQIALIGKPISSGLAVSPDRKWILYAQIDHAGSDLMLVENFR